MRYLNFMSVYRKHKRLTQWDIADALKADRSAVSLWENGRLLPSIDMRMKICELLGEDIKKVFP